MLMALGGIPALAQLVILPFFPESPPYFLIHKGDEEGCMKGNIDIFPLGFISFGLANSKINIPPRVK